MSEPVVRYWDSNWNLLKDWTAAENITADGTFGHVNAVRLSARVERHLVTKEPQSALPEGNTNA